MFMFWLNNPGLSCTSKFMRTFAPVCVAIFLRVGNGTRHRAGAFCILLRSSLHFCSYSVPSYPLWFFNVISSLLYGVRSLALAARTVAVGLRQKVDRQMLDGRQIFPFLSRRCGRLFLRSLFCICSECCCARALHIERRTPNAARGDRRAAENKGRIIALWTIYYLKFNSNF